MPDHEDSDKHVQQACTQSAAPSSTNAVVEEVATLGVFRKKTPGMPQHSEQTATSAAFYRAFISPITSLICPHCGSVEEMADHLLLLCPKLEAEC